MLFYLLLVALVQSQVLPFSSLSDIPEVQQNDYVLFPVNSTVGREPIVQVFPIDYYEAGKHIIGTAYILENPLGRFSFYPSLQGCPGRNRTSDNAKVRKCVAASNAGFFDPPTGGCIGNIVSDGQVIQTSTKSWANFGITKDGFFGVGYFDGTQLAGNFTQLVQSALWLVRDGKSHVDEAIKIEQPSDYFCKLLAPRVAIGHNKQGHLLVVEINGMESEHRGLNVWEMTQVMLKYGAINAVNLDGGGSSTMVYKGQILSECCDICSEGQKANHCPSSPIRCERAVTTITCVHE